MQLLLNMDEHNYDPELPEIRRTAVRGIIFREGRLLLIQSYFGEVKLPGGGQEAGESDMETLCREVLEETGFHVLEETVKPFGQVIEKCLSRYEPMIWHQQNRYYFCSVSEEQRECQYSRSEQKYGMHQLWMTLEEALQTNREMLDREGANPWNQREYRVMELLAKHLKESE